MTLNKSMTMRWQWFSNYKQIIKLFGSNFCFTCSLKTYIYLITFAIQLFYKIYFHSRELHCFICYRYIDYNRCITVSNAIITSNGKFHNSSYFSHIEFKRLLVIFVQLIIKRISTDYSGCMACLNIQPYPAYY